ncbi:hypothetical protein OKW41_006726 [Paraburkholderia sp. UCT70]
MQDRHRLVPSWLVLQPSGKGEVINRITRVGVDLAKNVMQTHAVDSAERIVVLKAIPRERFVSWFANEQKSKVVYGGVEAED